MHRPTDRTAAPELTLDPADWEGMRQLGHRMVDDMLTSLRTIRDRPVFQPIPTAIRASLTEPVPRQPQAAEAVYADFQRMVLPYPHGNIHPRFWGWVVGAGTPLGMLADLLAGGLNSNTGFGDHGAIHVEQQVIAWLKEALGLPKQNSGTLTSGCTTANLTALTIARNTHAGGDVRATGIQDAARLTVYGSVETHSSNLRALEVLGLGRRAFRPIPTGADHRIDIDQLRERIRADRGDGCQPICIIGNAGTVNVGAFDDLSALADVAAAEGLWLHVDGAFGALTALSPRLRPLVRGLDRADSVAFDLHKWLHVPYDCGAVMVRDADRHHDAFRMSGAYLAHFESGLASGPINLMEHGLQMSRGFRALKAWMTIKEHGVDRLGAAIAQNVDQAAYLARRVEATAELQLVAPVPLNIVNFRYVPVRLDGPVVDVDRLNREILAALHQSGVAAPSHTALEGRFVVRVSITNHRSRQEDFDLLVHEVLRLGRELDAQHPEWSS
ncbi:MAG: pyridoxal-dependent decarboxylase [Planctomycetota bacterium]